MGSHQPDTEAMLAGHGLTTAEILYHRPDAPTLLQTYTWQLYDLAPNFPKLHDFLAWWQRELDGPLHSVRYSHQRLIRPGEWRKVDGEILLN